MITPAQRHKAKQEALGRKARIMWTTEEEHEFLMLQRDLHRKRQARKAKK